MLRIRDDKPNANHKSIMEKIMISIEDGVDIEAVRRLCQAVSA
jgi:mRNA guanylyltransferase